MSCGHRWVYLIVVLILLCPMKSWTFLTGAPFCIRRVQQVCRRMCGTKFGSSVLPIARRTLFHCFVIQHSYSHISFSWSLLVFARYARLSKARSVSGIDLLVPFFVSWRYTTPCAPCSGCMSYIVSFLSSPQRIPVSINILTTW